MNNTWLILTLGLTLLSTCLRQAASQCGVVSKMSKIVGGDEVTSLEFPWYVALVMRESSSSALSVSCGGSLITNRHVLSAAHCFPKNSGGRPENLYRAVLGLVDRCEQTDAESSRISKVHIYPTFNSQTLEGDVAVITLERTVSYTPICLPPKGSVVTGQASIIGFGSTLAKSTSQYPCTLQEAEVTIFSRRQCQRSGLESKFSRLPGIYCAGVLRGGIDSCDGDSGGPLQTQTSRGVYTIQGVVSFGEGCARRNLPGVYTQVSYYRDFIDRATSESDNSWGGSESVDTSSSYSSPSIVDTSSSYSSPSILDTSSSFSSPSIIDTSYSLSSSPSIFDTSSSFSSSFSLPSFFSDLSWDSWNPFYSRSLNSSSSSVRAPSFGLRPRPPSSIHSVLHNIFNRDRRRNFTLP